MSYDGWADNKTFSFDCIFTFTVPARVPSPFLKVMDCTDSGCDMVSLRRTCTLSFCSASDVALCLRLEKVKNESAFPCSALGVTTTEEASLKALTCVACVLPALSQKSLSRLLI